LNSSSTNQCIAEDMVKIAKDTNRLCWEIFQV